ncbi:unnamed protein product [Candidula unifasciata]|uniref:Protein SERAC1 n=1 Tax=Candidula unifasciata TaxID=100452 RepID=A0A8S3ZEH3_9EUPU|nr:unnamed protein product [Candidula unifasciata]
MMNGCIPRNLRCYWIHLRHFKRQKLPILPVQNVPSRRKRSLLYGFIVLTAVGSGGAFLFSAEQVDWSRLCGSIFQSLNDRILQSVVSPDTLWVGLEDDWPVYMSAPHHNELSSRVLMYVSDIINFNINQIWDWLFPWEQSKSDDPWVLLELTRSSNFWIRQMGVASLADKVNWPSYKYRLVAQACDHRTTVALARYPHASDAYFLPQPRIHPSKYSILHDLKDQLSKLPMPPSVNSCTMYYRFVSLDQDYMFQKDLLGMDFLAHSYTLPGEEEKKNEQAIGFCLEGISSYTSDPQYATMFVENCGLAVLQQLLEEIPENWVQLYVATILSNLSMVPDLLDAIVSTGWVYVLRLWSRSSNAALSLLALTTLANLDRDWIYRDFYQDMVLLHPTQRNSQPFYADVVLVHGLRGGAVKTWRQRDPDKDNQQNQCVCSPCWPKDWLASDCPNLRIISIGYNSSLHRWGDSCPYEQEKRTIDGRSRELLKKLQKAGVGSRPIIWIGHSMGGLLIKQILSLGQQENEFSQFASQTQGVIFYSVPHHGSSVVDVLMYAKYLLFPSVEVQEMHTHSPKLSLLHQEFVNFMTVNSIPCLSFGENAKTTFGRTLPKVLVVPLESSDPGIGKFVSVPNDHINTCKPCSKDDIIYQLTCSFVRDILHQIRR